MILNKLAPALVLVLSLIPTDLCLGTQVIGITGSEDPLPFSLVNIPSNGKLELVGPTGFATGLDFSPDGSTLYSASSSLREIDPSTGETISSVDFEGGRLFRSITVAPDGTIWASDAEGIYKVDAKTGGFDLLSSPAELLWGIEFAPDGRLFAGFANLYELSPDDGSVINDLGPLGTFVTDFDFSDDGTLRAVSAVSAPVDSPALYEIDIDTAEAILITDLPQVVWSIATLPVPEPSGALLAGSLLLAFLGCCRKQS